MRRARTGPHFEFRPRDHLALGTSLRLLDFEAGARVAGQKFYFLVNQAVALELALQRFALDHLTPGPLGGAVGTKRHAARA